MVLLAAGCDAAAPAVKPEPQVVVRAFLYAGEPVTDVQLTTTTTLDAQDALGPPITDALVVLFKQDTTLYPLAPTQKQPGFYHYPGIDLTVEAGDVFYLVVEYQGRQTTAVTQIPPPPDNLAFSDTLVALNDATPDDAVLLTVSWDNPGGKLHWIAARNLESAPPPIRPDDTPHSPGDLLRSDVFNGDRAEIRARDFRYFGRHEVRLYRISDEYGTLYQFATRPVERLYAPHTNVQNGLGLFAGFNGVSRYVRVLRRQ